MNKSRIAIQVKAEIKIVSTEFRAFLSEYVFQAYPFHNLLTFDLDQIIIIYACYTMMLSGNSLKKNIVCYVIITVVAMNFTNRHVKLNIIFLFVKIAFNCGK